MNGAAQDDNKIKVPQKPIILYRGDDTDFLGNQSIRITIKTELDISECSVHFNLLGVQRVVTELDEDKSFVLNFSRDDTKDFPTGEVFASLWLVDEASKRRTVADNIRFVITNNAQFAYHASEQFITLVMEGSIPSVKWENVEGKPTTLAGYGITDAVKTVNGVAPDENGNVTVEAASGGLAPEFVAGQGYYENDIVTHGGKVYRCTANYSGDWDTDYFTETTLGGEIEERQRLLSFALTHHDNIAPMYEGAGSEVVYAVGDLRFFDTAPYPTLMRCIVAGDADTAEWEETSIAELLAMRGGFTRKYVVVSGAESDEQMPTLMDFEQGKILYDSGDDDQMPTAQELLGGDMVAELYMAGENRQGIVIYHDGIIIVKPYGGEMQVYEYGVVISDIMPVQTVLAKIYAAVQGDSEKPILIVELS